MKRLSSHAEFPDQNGEHNRYGEDVATAEARDGRLLDRDYSLEGGVTMRWPFDHGFPKKVVQTKTDNHLGKGPKDWKRGDERVFEEVCEALTQNPLIDASDIEVEVKDGIVYLRGLVDDRPTKREAELCSEKITGVHDVVNELKIRPLNLL